MEITELEITEVEKNLSLKFGSVKSLSHVLLCPMDCSAPDFPVHH